MALALALVHPGVAVLVAIISIAWGLAALGWLRLAVEDAFEALLFAAGVSFPTLEVVLFGLTALGWLNGTSALTVLALMALTAWRGWQRAWTLGRTLASSAARELTLSLDRGIAAVALALLVVQGLLAMAPLTGSDAMHYHFTVPLIEQGHRLLPIFWLTHSFFLGQAHQLIYMGLALGSDHISLGLIYLGGVFAAGALFVLARQLMPVRWALLATLSFVAAPLVFWQGSTSGSPDMWMAFFVPLACLAAARGCEPTAGKDSLRWFALAGYFAGAAAGAKYTAWVIPVALVLYILAVKKSLLVAAVAGFASLVSGIWPLARNWFWTGDPVFPFLTPQFAPKLANPHALAAIKAVTSTEAFGRDLPHVLKFPFALVLHGDSYGLGQYFGPLVLAFAPLLFFAPWKKPVARIAATFWAVAFLSILFANQMGRFLLPVFPLALALVFSGAAEAAARGWRAIAAGSGATIALFLLFSSGADALYAKNFLPVLLGAETREAFLRRAAPDYAIDEFIDRTLQPEIDRGDGGRVMVFYRHVYYLRTPFVEGAPENSWLMNPAALRDPRAMLALLARLDVRWVAKTDEYPESLAAVFTQMENAGALAPIASADIPNLTGASRIYRETSLVHVTVLRVNDRH